MRPDRTTQLEHLIANHLLHFDKPRTFGLGQFHCEYFIDLLSAVHHPEVLDTATALARELFPAHVLQGARSVVGPKSGNGLLCNSVARSLGLPSACVRDYPLVGRYIEGHIEIHQRSVVFDDVASDGELLAEVARHLRSAGVQVDHAVVIVNRIDADARDVLADLNIDLTSGLEVADPELAQLFTERRTRPQKQTLRP